MRKSVGGTTFLKRQSNFARVETICVVMSLAVESSVDPEIEECEVTISGQERKLDTSKDVEDTVQAINDSEKLTTLRLSGNSMGVQASMAIAGALTKRPTLRRALWSDMFVGRLKSEIPPAVTKLGEAMMGARAQLVELDLSDNAFGPAGIRAIFTLLTSSVCHTLKILKLDNTGMGSQGGVMLATALQQCHEDACLEGGKLQLEVFVVGRSRLENNGATALAEVFGKLGSLVEVSMPQNGINKEGISALATAFEKNTNLTSIDLNDNTFTEEGAVAMAAVLPSLQKLERINFGDCLLKPDGGRAIATAITNGHMKLKELNLGFNSLDSSSALAVAEALSNKTELKKIDLNGNCLGETGTEALRECLEAKGLVECLDSLGDDEGTASEGEEENEDKEEGEEERGGEREGDEIQTETEGIKAQVTVEDYLRDPSGDNLLSLGNKRIELLTATLGESWRGVEAGQLYVKVSSCYSETISPVLKSAVENTIDAVVQPVCEAGQTANFLNEILVQVGLIKSEDKSFKPLQDDVDGPVLALTHLVKQPYFPRQSRDTLIAFIQKPHQALTTTRPKVLQALYSP